MEKKLENSKRHIRFVATIGNKESIIQELEKRAENPTILENREQLKKQLESFKNDFNNENYNNSDVFAEYMTNKTGKYIVVCMDTKHMHEMIRKTHELFDKVNPNVNVSYMGSGMFDSAKEEMIRKFDELENENESLNLLFLNKATTRYYNANNVDGVILFAYARFHTNRNLAIVNEALKSCADNGIVIQVVDSIGTITKYETLQERVKSEGKYIVDFYKSDSFLIAENFRDATYSKKIDDNFKLELMQEYKNRTGKDITTDSIYKGYHIGVWKNNLRQFDVNGKLDMEDDLRKKFEEEGILGERQRRNRTTDIDKYNLLLQFNEKNPDVDITNKTVDEFDNPIGYYRVWLQVRVNKKTTELTKEQIAHLKELGYLNLSSSEVKELSERLNIPEANIRNIIKEYRSIKGFARKYKSGDINPKNIKLNKRGIILSKNGLSMEQKQAYINLIEDIFGKNILDDKSKFVYEEDILNAIDKLTDKRKQIIIERYGLDGQEPKKLKDIGKDFINSRQHAKNLMVTALKMLSENVSVYSIKDLRNSRDNISKKLKYEKSISYEEWKCKKISSDIKILGLNEFVTQRLKNNGYRIMADLFKASKGELLTLKGIGVSKVNEIIQRTKEYDSNIVPSKKTEETKILESELEKVKSVITHYAKAYNYYMTQENIFGQNEIIPPSIVEEETISKLDKKKEERAIKQKTLDTLGEDLNKQDEITNKLQSVLRVEDNLKIRDENN